MTRVKIPAGLLLQTLKCYCRVCACVYFGDFPVSWDSSVRELSVLL